MTPDYVGFEIMDTKISFIDLKPVKFWVLFIFYILSIQPPLLIHKREQTNFILSCTDMFKI